MKIFHAVERGIEIPENLDDLVIPEEKQNTVTLDKPETVSYTHLDVYKRQVSVRRCFKICL